MIYLQSVDRPGKDLPKSLASLGVVIHQNPSKHTYCVRPLFTPVVRSPAGTIASPQPEAAV